MVARELPTGTLTFLFTDIEGSTRLLHEVGERYGDLLEAHRRLVRATVTAHGGVEFGTGGDAVFAVFESCSAAVAAAAEAQRAISAHPWPENITMKVRMALHSGDAQVIDNDYVGVPLHVVARLCAAGHGGQVLLSDATYVACPTHIGGRARRSFLDLRLLQPIPSRFRFDEHCPCASGEGESFDEQSFGIVLGCSEPVASRGLLDERTRPEYRRLHVGRGRGRGRRDLCGSFFVTCRERELCERDVDRLTHTGAVLRETTRVRLELLAQHGRRVQFAAEISGVREPHHRGEPRTLAGQAPDAICRESSYDRSGALEITCSGERQGERGLVRRDVGIHFLGSLDRGHQLTDATLVEPNQHEVRAEVDAWIESSCGLECSRDLEHGRGHLLGGGELAVQEQICRSTVREEQGVGRPRTGTHASLEIGECRPRVRDSTRFEAIRPAGGVGDDTEDRLTQLSAQVRLIRRRP